MILRCVKFCFGAAWVLAGGNQRLAFNLLGGVFFTID